MDNIKVFNNYVLCSKVIASDNPFLIESDDKNNSVISAKVIRKGNGEKIIKLNIEKDDIIFFPSFSSYKFSNLNDHSELFFVSCNDILGKKQ